ncbi:hypothetical protein R1flu_015257 [Riccia fluitans]|uniref:Uncharacterized protein n=1 Tax=Riccia fluitans TaxID=41844 RepID=A0ABD1YIE1_9MARC
MPSRVFKAGKWATGSKERAAGQSGRAPCGGQPTPSIWPLVGRRAPCRWGRPPFQRPPCESGEALGGAVLYLEEIGLV